MPLAPTISEIYAAFDSAAHQLFRGAMARSRGGIVRLRDLLGALVESAAVPEELIPPGWRQHASFQSSEPWMTPMANEPALRDVLATAHRLAGSTTPATITPHVLFTAALLRQPGAVHSSPSQVAVPPASALARPVSPLKPEPEPLNSLQRQAEIEHWFQRWIQAQQM